MMEAMSPEGLAPDARHTKAANRQSSAVQANGSYLPSSFLRELEATVKQQFASGERQLQSYLRSRILQFWFGESRQVHYEVWIHERTMQLEIGLHFEASPARNRDLYLRFDRELLAIQAHLGTSMWLEEWDRGWARIYETHPLWPLDSVRVEEIANRLSEIISALQPLLDD